MKNKLALLQTALAISLWAVSFVFIKIALRQVSPVTLIILRYAMGVLILGAVALARGELAQLRREDLRWLALLGAVGVTLQQMLQVSGQASAEAAVAAFLASSAPAFMVLLSYIFLHEKLRAGQVLGVLLATFGAGLVSTGGNLGAVLRGEVDNWGNWLVLLSAVVWAIYTMLNHHVARQRPPALTAAGMMFFGWCFTLPFFLAQGGWRELPGLSWETWQALLYTGVLSTALAYLLYTHALKQAPASQLAAIQNIEPLVATLAAALILGERLTWVLLLGGAAILGGVYLAERAPEEEKKVHPLMSANNGFSNERE